jgi:hypothetical protein
MAFAAFKAAAQFLKVGYQPGGDIVATAVQVFNEMVQFQERSNSR